MSKERHTFTLNRETVRRANRMRGTGSLSAFVDEAIMAYTEMLERAAHEAMPPTIGERRWLAAATEGFVADGDDTDWEAVLAARTSLAS